MNFSHINEQEVRQIIREVTIKVARYLNMAYPELQDTFVLNEEIRRSDERLACLLKDFSTAYLNFYYNAQTISFNKKGLTDFENNKLQTLFNEKEFYKKELLKQISSSGAFIKSTDSIPHSVN